MRQGKANRANVLKSSSSSRGDGEHVLDHVLDQKLLENLATIAQLTDSRLTGLSCC